MLTHNNFYVAPNIHNFFSSKKIKDDIGKICGLCGEKNKFQLLNTVFTLSQQLQITAYKKGSNV